MAETPLRSPSSTPRLARRPRLGFVGVGWIGRHRMEAVVKSGVAEAAALLDPTPEALAEARRAAPDARVVASFDEMLAQDIDGLVIATPNALHADQSAAALERGIAVFCQKPLGRTAPETARVVAAARAADRPLGVDLSYRHTRAMLAIRDAVRRGEAGDLFAADLVFHNAYGPDKAWFYDVARSGGGCVLDLGIHLVDLALWLMDFPEVRGVESRLYAKGRLLPPAPGEVEDFAAARMDLANGATVRLACSWRLHAGCDAVIGAEFHGTRGGLAMRNVNGSFYDFVAEQYAGTSRRSLVAPPDDWGGRAIVHWAERLARGEGFDRESERLVSVAKVLDGVYGR